MYAVFVLVKNLTSNSDVLEFSNFLFKEIKQGDNDALIKAQKLFSVGIPLYGD